MTHPLRWGAHLDPDAIASGSLDVIAAGAVTAGAVGDAVVASDQATDPTLDQAMLGELAESLPVREFRWYRGQRHYSGWYWASTTKGHVAYESRLELARIMLADFDPNVTAIAAQPFRLISADGTRIRRHAPDVLLVMSDGGVMVVDVKSPRQPGSPRRPARKAHWRSPMPRHASRQMTWPMSSHANVASVAPDRT